MSEAEPYRNLPILLSTIRQESGDGELVLDQNDGVRRFYFRKGQLIYLSSDAAGEQFGNYLLRQGIVDLSSLNALLANHEHYRIGEKVVQCGLMSLDERDSHLRSLQEQIMIHALESPIRSWSWNSGPIERLLSRDLQIAMLNRHFLWRAFQESSYLAQLLPIFKAETTWEWQGQGNLLDALSDLPLTPSTAYAISFLTADPMSFATFRYLSHFSEEDTGRFIATLWALGAIAIPGGILASVTTVSRSSPSDSKPLLPLILPPPNMPFGPPKKAPQEALLGLDSIDGSSQPEFMDLGPGSDSEQPMNLQMLSMIDLPPCGPRPPSRSQVWPDDMPPCGPRAQPRAQPSPVSDDMPPCGPRPQLRPQALPEDMPPCGPRPQPQSPPLPVPEDVPPCGPRLQSQPPFTFSSRPQSIELDPDRRGIPDPPTPQSLAKQAQMTRLLGQARRQVMMGRTLEAVYTLEQAVKVDPDGEVAYEAWLMLGKLRMTNLAWSTRAIHALQSASRIRIREVEPWSTMGEIYHRTGLETEAAACFRKALELNPSVAIPPGVDLNEASKRGAHLPSQKKEPFTDEHSGRGQRGKQ